MVWNIDFITFDNFREHVSNTIKKYGEKLEPYNIVNFNSNIIDPVKMIFDQAVYRSDWQTIISNEIYRQRDKSNNNEIGYFHQRLFSYIDNCTVPSNGENGGWDVIYNCNNQYPLESGEKINKIYVELKNKHNTMNSSAASKTYVKMQSQLLKEDDCACFLVEAIAKKSQNITWETTIDKQKVKHKRIRRVSIDRFYEIVTGQADAFYKICMALPLTIQEILQESNGVLKSPQDIVYDELKETAESFSNLPESQAMILSLYFLGFSSYAGFKKKQEEYNYATI